jgi:hypothetical protein
MKNNLKTSLLFISAFIAFASVAQARTSTLFTQKIQSTSVAADGVNKVLYFGGPVISNVKVMAVFWGNQVDPTTVAKIGGFYSSITDSDYMDWMKEYDTNIIAQDGKQGTNQHIGRGSLGGTFTIAPINKNAKLSQSDIQGELVNQIAQNSLPKPDADTLYMVYFPANITISISFGDSCAAWCGDHEGFTDPKFGNIYYAMMPDLGGSCAFGCGFASDPFSSLTFISSHEMSEAVTDPLSPLANVAPARPAGWLALDQNEIGDLCTSSSGDLKSGSVLYSVEGEWDNTINGCKAGHFTSAFTQ